ncbi:MAG TPA: transcriptional regulator [Roseiarcus sp.]
MITSEQIRAARALLRWEEQDLAEAAKLPRATIARLESLPGPLAAEPSAVEALRTALGSAGIDLLEEDGGGVGVWLRKPNGEPIPLEELNASNDE